MMDAAAEEYSLGIYHELVEFFGGAVAFVVLDNILENFPDGKVVFAVLVPIYIPAILCSLAEMIYIFFLFQAELVPSRNLITHNLDVSKFIDKVLEFSSFPALSAR